MYLAYDVGPMLFSVLEVYSSVSPVCMTWLCVLCLPAVGVDRQDLLSSSLCLPGASGMSSPGMVILGPPLAPSSGSGRKANCIMFLHSSLSPSFILRISCAETGGAILGFIFGVRYYIFLLTFLNLMSLCMWANSLSMLLDSLCIRVSSCVSFIKISSLSPCSCALSCLTALSAYITQRST